MNTNEQIEESQAALAILKSTGVNVLEAALIAKDALSAGCGKLKRARLCIAAGKTILKLRNKTVSFKKAVQAALEARKHRRARTLCDFRYVMRRFMKRCPGLAQRRLRTISPTECAEYIAMAFDTPCQQRKARLMLSGVFSTAIKRGWCDKNPVSQVEKPIVEEKRTPILSPQEIKQITNAAETYRNGCCAAAVGMMLYAGIRPHEVARLTWEQVDLREQTICIHPRHSKTGGARRVSIFKPLQRILERHRQAKAQSICPSNWQKHWRKLRQQAGWNTHDHRWSEDALRHTFASYHLCRFRSYAELQLELGHRDTSLLRTRYVDMNGVKSASKFWN